MSYADDIEQALMEGEGITTVLGLGPRDGLKPQPHVYMYGNPPEEFRQVDPVGADAEAVPLVLGAEVVIRTRDGIKVAEGYIEDVMFETRTVRVRDTSSGTDVQLDVDPDRYTVEVKSDDVLGLAPEPGQETLYLRPSRPGARKGAFGSPRGQGA